MLTLEEVFSPFALRIACGPLEIRVLRDDDLPELVDLVGMQDLHAKDFAQVRQVMTGSWLGRAHHGIGTGTLMRQLVVGFAFDQLDADRCESGYIVGNRGRARSAWTSSR